MNITIKNLKVAEFASEETLCFEATVYVDGVRAFIATNDGRGGCNFYHPIDGRDRSAIKAAEAYAATVETEFNFEQLDSLIDKLITTKQIAKDAKRLLKKAAVFDDGKIFTWKCPITHPRIRAVIAEKRPNGIILNDLPLAEAVEYFRRAA